MRNSKIPFKIILVLLSVLMFLPSALFAATYSFSGVVHENSASGPGISGATVSVQGKSATTNVYGQFIISDLSRGNTYISISKPGYTPFSKNPHTIDGNLPNINFFLVKINTTPVSAPNVTSANSNPAGKLDNEKYGNKREKGPGEQRPAPVPNITYVSTNPASITAGQSATFSATTDRVASKVILRFTDAGVDVAMNGNGTNWSVTPALNTAGNRPFIVTAYDAQNKAGTTKSGAIQVTVPERKKESGGKQDNDKSGKKRERSSSEPPTVKISATPVMLAKKGDKVIIRAEADDDKALKQIDVTCQYNNGPKRQLDSDTVKRPGSTHAAVEFDYKTVDAGVLNLCATAIDVSGNISKEACTIVTIAKSEPRITNGFILATIQPKVAADNAGVGFKIDTKADVNKAGVKTSTTTGNHSVTFTAADNWLPKQAVHTVSVRPNETEPVLAEYVCKSDTKPCEKSPRILMKRSEALGCNFDVKVCPSSGGFILATIQPKAVADVAAVGFKIDTKPDLNKAGIKVPTTTGNHTVTFTSVDNWLPKQAVHTVSVRPNETEPVLAEYVCKSDTKPCEKSPRILMKRSEALGCNFDVKVCPSGGFILATIQPKAAADTASIGFKIDTKPELNKAGIKAPTTIGNHTVTFTSVDNWLPKQAIHTVSVRPNETEPVLAEYVCKSDTKPCEKSPKILMKRSDALGCNFDAKICPTDGFILATIQPKAAADVAAIGFNIDTKTDVNKSGVKTSTTAGNHTVTFTAADNWLPKQAIHTVSVRPNETEPVLAEYVCKSDTKPCEKTPNVLMKRSDALGCNFDVKACPADGFILATIQPKAAADNAAVGFRIDTKPEFNKSGVRTITAAGNHTVTFNSLDNWLPKQAVYTVSVRPNETVPVLAEYVCKSDTKPCEKTPNILMKRSDALGCNFDVKICPTDGFILATIQPKAAADNAAIGFKIDTKPEFIKAGVKSPATAGNHTVTFTSTDNWLPKQAIHTVSVRPNETEPVLAEYACKSDTKACIKYPNIQMKRTEANSCSYDESVCIGGEVMTVILPAEVVKAGAQWKLDGGTWLNDGGRVTTTVGKHTVSFKDVSGWNTPLLQNIEVKNNTTTSVQGRYEKKQGKVKVIVQPAACSADGLKWKLGNGSLHVSGDIETLDAGAYTLDFSGTKLFSKPSSRSVLVSADKTETITVDCNACISDEQYCENDCEKTVPRTPRNSCNLDYSVCKDSISPSMTLEVTPKIIKVGGEILITVKGKDNAELRGVNVSASFNGGTQYNIVNSNIGACVGEIDHDEEHTLPKSKVNKTGELVIKAYVTDSSGNVTTRSATVTVK